MIHFFILFIICMSNFGKEVTAEYVKECLQYSKVHFLQVEGTSGNFNEVIARGKQFVSLQKNELTIFEDLKPIIRKSFSQTPRGLNLDLFNNILFSNEGFDGIYTYILENDDLILKGFGKGVTTRRGVAIDNNNTVYAIAGKNIFYAKLSNAGFNRHRQLKDFDNVTHIVNGDRNNFYFAHDSKRTSWVVNAATEQTIIQTSSIKHMNYISEDSYAEMGYIYFIDHNCIMKVVNFGEKYILQKNFIHNYIRVMQLEDCNYGIGVKFIFRTEEVSKISYFFNKNKVYRLSVESGYMEDTPLKVCLHGKLDNVTINSGAVNSKYIMLATSNGLWVSKW